MTTVTITTITIPTTVFPPISLCSTTFSRTNLIRRRNHDSELIRNPADEQLIPLNLACPQTIQFLESMRIMWVRRNFAIIFSNCQGSTSKSLAIGHNSNTMQKYKCSGMQLDVFDIWSDALEMLVIWFGDIKQTIKQWVESVVDTIKGVEAQWLHLQSPEACRSRFLRVW